MSWLYLAYASAATTAAGVSYAVDVYNESEDNKNRPTYKIPQEYFTNLTIAERKALEGLPPDVQKAWVENNKSNLAAQLNSIGNVDTGLGGVEGALRVSNANLKDLSNENSMAMNEWDKMAGQARLGIANQKDVAFQLNDLNPYYEHIARRDTRNRNLMSSLNSAGSIGASGMGGMMKSNTPSTTTPSESPSKDMGVNGTSPYAQGYNPNSNYVESGNKEFSMLDNPYQRTPKMQSDTPYYLSNSENDNYWQYK